METLHITLFSWRNKYRKLRKKIEEKKKIRILLRKFKKESHIKSRQCNIEQFLFFTFSFKNSCLPSIPMMYLHEPMTNKNQGWIFSI
jgi:hypothetical protein